MNLKTLIVLFLLTNSTIHAKKKNEIESDSIKWKKVILRNSIEFKNREDINHGSSFLVKLDTITIACTSRYFTGTYNNFLTQKDFQSELTSWKMFQLNSDGNHVIVKSIYNEKRIEKNSSIISIINPFLTFTVNDNPLIESLEPDTSKIKNKSAVYIVGYDNENNLKVIEGLVETALNSKYVTSEIRIRTKEYLKDLNFIGSPIVNTKGKVIGVFNRAYALKKNKKGKIIAFDKASPDSYYEYFVNGTIMRKILGKKYGK